MMVNFYVLIYTQFMFFIYIYIYIYIYNTVFQLLLVQYLLFVNICNHDNDSVILTSDLFYFSIDLGWRPIGQSM